MAEGNGIPKRSRRTDITGQKFGMLFVIGYSHTINRRCMWHCRCECGTTKVFAYGDLTAPGSKSCGCMSSEFKRASAFKHGFGKTGESRRSEYTTWANMLSRCNNKHKNYGDRGITVCERWADFANFLADMGTKPTPSHTIERIDNDGNYEPGNCRWATRTEQSRNRRNVRVIECRGQRLCVAEWSRISGVNATTIYARLNKGWDGEAAVFQKSRGH